MLQPRNIFRSLKIVILKFICCLLYSCFKSLPIFDENTMSSKTTAIMINSGPLRNKYILLSNIGVLYPQYKRAMCISDPMY